VSGYESLVTGGDNALFLLDGSAGVGPVAIVSTT
jgi:hypothetical protein